MPTFADKEEVVASGVKQRLTVAGFPEADWPSGHAGLILASPGRSTLLPAA
jgi:hypothetical protein